MQWNERADLVFLTRAIAQSRRLGHPWCGVEHALLALLTSEVETDALQVLRDTGATIDAAEEQANAIGQGLSVSRADPVLNPALMRLLAVATGLALAFRHESVMDEDVLLSLLYGRHRSLLTKCGAPPEAIVSALRERSHSVDFELPIDSRQIGATAMTRTYYPIEHHGAVTRALAHRFPQGTVSWGFNRSSWRGGFMYVDAEARSNADQLIAEIIGHGAVVVVPTQRGVELEISTDT